MMLVVVVVLVVALLAVMAVLRETGRVVDRTVSALSVAGSATVGCRAVSD